MHGYTPLMLAVAQGDKNIDCVKVLLGHQADYKKKDSYDNNLLHIAAIYGSNKIIEYLCKSIKIDLNERNAKGETALFICQQNHNTEGSEIFEKYNKQFD